VKLAGNIDNREGEIAANGDIQLAAQSVDNQGGKVLAAQHGSLTAHARTTLDNRQGTSRRQAIRGSTPGCSTITKG
jgi:filamentous hemagglutinin